MTAMKKLWAGFKAKHPTAAQFLVFFLLSNGVTVLQMILMPVMKGIFNQTGLVDIACQLFPVGHNLDGSRYYIFNYAAGPVAADGTGGGLAYFLAVEITMAVAQVINFFLQRNVTFKSNSSMGRAAFWYVVAYIGITLAAGAAQGLYKAPIYSFLMGAMGAGAGQTVADFVTMIINCAISFWVFFPIFKVIFKQEPEKQD
jgi:putative flippase GtrA